MNSCSTQIITINNVQLPKEMLGVKGKAVPSIGHLGTAMKPCIGSDSSCGNSKLFCWLLRCVMDD